MKERAPGRLTGSGGDDVERDGGGDAIVQLDGHLVVAERLDRVGHHDRALVDLLAGRLARALAISPTVTAPNRRPPAPARTLTLTDWASSLVLISSAWSRSRTAREERAALIDSICLLATTGPAQREAARDEVVAAVAVLHLDDVAGGTETGDFLGQDELHVLSSSQRPVDV